MSERTQSLLLGIITILCWGSLATFGNLLVNLPPFYLLGVSFLIGALPGFTRPREMFTQWKVTLWGIGGYFAYHFFLFYSFRFAPAVEANLINYLWPILMVLFAPLFFPQERLRFYHFLGGMLAVVGCTFLVMGEGGAFKIEYLKGYLLAFLAALSWPLYSLGKKKMGEVPLRSISGFCLGAGILSLLTHAWLEPRVVLQWHDGWKLLLMGLGPFGLAFYTWDLALKKGDARVIGALSYLTPVLSTTGLVLFGGQSMTPSRLVAMILIIGGASTGLLDFLPSKLLKKSPDL